MHKVTIRTGWDLTEQTTFLHEGAEPFAAVTRWAAQAYAAVRPVRVVRDTDTRGRILVNALTDRSLDHGDEPDYGDVVGTVEIAHAGATDPAGRYLVAVGGKLSEPWVQVDRRRVAR